MSSEKEDDSCEYCGGDLEHSKEKETGVCYSCSYVDSDDGDRWEGYGADSEFNSAVLGDC